MRTHLRPAGIVFCILMLLGWIGLPPLTVDAAAYNCTEAGLDAALATGGDATFNCSGPTTITIGAMKTVAHDAHLDGGNLLTISGGDTTRIFSVTVGISLTLENMTLSHGHATNGAGGAIFNQGSLTIASATLRDNTATGANGANNITGTGENGGNGYGGAVYNGNGTVTITGSTFHANRTQGGNGGSGFNGGYGGYGYGGAVYNHTGMLTITGSSFDGNRSMGGGGGTRAGGGSGGGGGSSYGGALATGGGTTIVSGTTFADNRVQPGTSAPAVSTVIYGNGGGIANAGSMTLHASTIISNSPLPTNQVGYGGGIQNTGSLTVTMSTIGNNASWIGGGIANTNSGRLILSNTTIISNSANIGGGLANELGSVSLADSRIFSNTISYQTGAGIWNRGTMAINTTTIAFNRAGDSELAGAGGGITNDSQLLVNNSTIMNNFGGGGITNTGSGAAVITNTTISQNTLRAIDNYGALALRNATIAYNPDGGIDNHGTVGLKNTIVAFNTGQYRGNCSGIIITDEGHNLQYGDTSCGAGFLTANPLLGPLRDNGGPTLTMALLPGSPAIDAGDSVGCPPTDQRGVSRPQLNGCDIGAYEYNGQVLLNWLPLMLKGGASGW